MTFDGGRQIGVSLLLLAPYGGRADRWQFPANLSRYRVPIAWIHQHRLALTDNPDQQHQVAPAKVHGRKSLTRE